MLARVPNPLFKKAFTKVNQRATINKQISDLQALLDTIESDYKAGHISKKAYHEVLRTNKALINKLKERLHGLDTVGIARRGKAEVDKAAKEVTKVADEDKPIGELLEQEEAKERAKLQAEIAKEGDANVFAQTSEDESAIDKIKKVLIGKKKLESKEEKPEDKPVEKKIPVDSGELTKLSMSVEKIKAEMLAFKEKDQFTQERISKITEELGEIRSLSFQKEKLVDEINLRLKKIEDAVADIEPNKFTLKLTKIKQNVEENATHLEKLENTIKTLGDFFNEIKSNLDDFGSVKNILDESKKVRDFLKKIEKDKVEAERSAEKAEASYLEAQRVLSDVTDIKAKLESMESLLKDTVKLVDKNSIKIDRSATKKDLELIRKTINKIIKKVRDFDNIKEDVKALQEEVGDIVIIEQAENKTKVPLKTTGKSAEEELQAQKEEIEDLLETLKEDYKKGRLSESAYNEAKQTNESFLKDLDKRIALLREAKSHVAEEPVKEAAVAAPVQIAKEESESEVPEQELAESKPLPAERQVTHLKLKDHEQPTESESDKAAPEDMPPKELKSEDSTDEDYGAEGEVLIGAPVEGASEEKAGIVHKDYDDATEKDSKKKEGELKELKSFEEDDDSEETDDEDAEEEFENFEDELNAYKKGKKEHKTSNNEAKKNSDTLNKVKEGIADGGPVSASKESAEPDELDEVIADVEELESADKSESIKEKDKADVEEGKREGIAILKSNSVEGLKAQRIKLKNALSAIRDHYSQGLINEQEYYALENRAFDKLRDINEKLSHALDKTA